MDCILRVCLVQFFPNDCILHSHQQYMSSCCSTLSAFGHSNGYLVLSHCFSICIFLMTYNVEIFSSAYLLFILFGQESVETFCPLFNWDVCPYCWVYCILVSSIFYLFDICVLQTFFPVFFHSVFNRKSFNFNKIQFINFLRSLHQTQSHTRFSIIF